MEKLSESMYVDRRDGYQAVLQFHVKPASDEAVIGAVNELFDSVERYNGIRQPEVPEQLQELRELEQLSDEGQIEPETYLTLAANTLGISGGSPRANIEYMLIDNGIVIEDLDRQIVEKEEIAMQLYPEIDIYSFIEKKTNEALSQRISYAKAFIVGEFKPEVDNYQNRLKNRQDKHIHNGMGEVEAYIATIPKAHRRQLKEEIISNIGGDIVSNISISYVPDEIVAQFDDYETAINMLNTQKAFAAQQGQDLGAVGTVSVMSLEDYQMLRETTVDVTEFKPGTLPDTELAQIAQQIVGGFFQ